MMRWGSGVRLAVTVTAALILLLAARPAALAATDCFTCHDRAAFQKKVKHQPAAPGQCGACHSLHAARHKGLLQKGVKALCYSCHSDATLSHAQGVVHQPVREGQCLACHDPHASENAGLLKKPASELCFDCHTKLPREFAHTHAPYAEGDCASCHRAHRSPRAALLVEEPEALCLGCHDRAAVQEKHTDYPAKVSKCGSCHSPHGSDRPGLVRNVLHEPYSQGCSDCHTTEGAAVTVDTCLRCHESVGEQMSSSHNHLVRYGENGCVACHSPHAGDDARLLRGKERYVCGMCHEDTFERSEKNRFRHKPTDSCLDCHAPHGSNYPVMTRAPINQVCARCHERHTQFSHPIGEKVFDPRTGQMMTCASCHITKGSEHGAHLRYDGHRDLCVQCHRDI